MLLAQSQLKQSRHLGQIVLNTLNQSIQLHDRNQIDHSKHFQEFLAQNRFWDWWLFVRTDWILIFKSVIKMFKGSAVQQELVSKAEQYLSNIMALWLRDLSYLAIWLKVTGHNYLFFSFFIHTHVTYNNHIMAAYQYFL